MATTDTNNRLFNIRIIGRNRSRHMTIQASSVEHAKERANRIGNMLSGGTRDISRRIEAVQVEGPLPQPKAL